MKNQKGITLVALIITIIVMLILAGVSISLVVGENGVLTQAQNAGDAQVRGQYQQGIELAFSDLLMQYYNGNDDDAYTIANLEKAIQENANITDDVTFVGALRFTYMNNATTPVKKEINNKPEDASEPEQLGTPPKYAEFVKDPSNTTGPYKLTTYKVSDINNKANLGKFVKTPPTSDLNTTDPKLKAYIEEGTLKIKVKNYLFEVTVTESNGKYKATKVNYVALEENHEI